MLSALTSLLGGGVVEKIGSVVDRFVTTDDEKARAKLELEKVLQARDSEVEQTLRQRMEMSAEVIKAEMQQGDKFTKRARPALVYWGMLLITLHHVAHIVVTISASSIIFPSLPSEFWVAWGGVVSVWVVGRSAEKVRGRGKTEESSILKTVMG